MTRIAFSERAITRISRTENGRASSTKVAGRTRVLIAALMSLAERPPLESLVS